MNMHYVGIGSRETPTHIASLMTAIAAKLEGLGYILHSGGADGADVAFENGISNPQNKCIFTTRDASPASLMHAEQYHPNWDVCSPKARKLHGRNSLILLGKGIDTPVRFVICWTKDGGATGGTGQGLRIASDYRIEIFNLYYPEVRQRFLNFVGETKQPTIWI